MKIQLALLDQIIVADHHPCKWAHQTGVARKERKQTTCVLDDVPWSRYDTEEGDEYAGPEYVYVLWRNACNILERGVRFLWT